MRDDTALHRSGSRSVDTVSNKGLFLRTNFTVNGSNSNNFSSVIPLTFPAAARATQAAVTFARRPLFKPRVIKEVVKANVKGFQGLSRGY